MAALLTNHSRIWEAEEQCFTFLCFFSCKSQPHHEEEEEISTSPGVSEFVSDAFDSAAFNQEDLRKEMEQLVLDKKDSIPSPDGSLHSSLLLLFILNINHF